MNPDKKVNFPALLFLFLGTAVTGSALSFLYLWINRVSTIIYVCILAAIALGLAMGFVSSLVIRFFKIRNLVPAMIVVIIACLGFSYFKWALYAASDARATFNSYYDFDYMMYLFWNIEYDFTDEDGKPVEDFTPLINAMKETSAYTYFGGDEWAREFDVDEEEAEFMRSISYYEYMAYDDILSTSTAEAADILNEFFHGSDYIYYLHFMEHGEPPTVVYFFTNPAALTDTIISINTEGRWSYGETHVNGVLLWLIWFAEFIFICFPAIIAIPRAVSALKESSFHPVSNIKITEYDTSAPDFMRLINENHPIDGNAPPGEVTNNTEESVPLAEDVAEAAEEAAEAPYEEELQPAGYVPEKSFTSASDFPSAHDIAHAADDCFDEFILFEAGRDD
jgi:hypothetical protein